MMSSYLSIGDIEDRGEIFLGEGSKRKNPVTKKIAMAAILSAIGTLLVLFSNNSIVVGSPISFFSLFSSKAVAEVGAPVEVFELKAPVTIPTSSSTISSFLLLNETSITDSIANDDYEAPLDVVANSTDLLFTLNFSTSGIQDPVIFELYIDEYPIWRTSTPNPLGEAANSSTIKNVTEFLPLLMSDSSVSLKLIDGSITGDVNVTLNATFITDDLKLGDTAPLPLTEIDVATIFENNQSFADVIVPLSNKGKPFELSSGPLSVTIPQLNFNVTEAKLNVFASASDEESKFFMTPISATSKTGPIRTLNIYLDDVFVGAISPNPILLKNNELGDNFDSSKLWVPLAAPGAFDALSYEIDLTAFLPLLWESTTELTIEAFSPLAGVTPIPLPPKPVPAPGVSPIKAKEWLVSGNLFAWESAAVNASIGELILTDSEYSGAGVLIAPPFSGFNSQVSRGKVNSGIQSQLNFTLIDGTEHNLTVNYNSTAFSVGTIIQKLAGASTSLTYISSSVQGLSVDDETLLPIFTRNITSSAPVIIKEDKASATMPWAAPPLNNSLEIAYVISTKNTINDVTQYSLHNKLNATIDDISYASDAKFSELTSASPVMYQREVVAEDGVITKDTALTDSSSFDAAATTEQFDDMLNFEAQNELFETLFEYALNF